MSGYADLSRTAYISPNDLMNSTRVNYYPQELQAKAQNDLLTNQHNQQLIGQGEAEMMGRVATDLLDPARYPDEASRAAAYPGAVAELQRYNFAKNAPSTYPGEAALRRVAALAVPAKDQYDRQGVAQQGADFRNRLTGDGTPGTATGGGGGAQARLLPGETEDQFLARIEARESGGRNVMNFRNKEDPTKFTAGGYYQIIDSTWKAGAQAAGIDISQYPTAISAPREVQTQVARSILRNFGPQNWNESEPGVDRSAALAGRVAPPGGAPAIRTAATSAPPPQRVTMPDPETGLPVLTGGPPAAPVAPAGGGRVQVASVTPTTMTDATPASGGAPGTPLQVAQQRAQATGQPAEIPGGLGWVLPNGNFLSHPPAAPAATAQPPAATTQQPPPPRPAEMPAELRTPISGGAAYLTPADVKEFNDRSRAAERIPGARGAALQTALEAEVEQRRAFNIGRQKDWIAQETAARTEEATARREQRQIEATERQIAATEARLQQDAREGNLKTDKQQFDKENTLRDEFGAQTASFRVVQSAYENIRSSSKVGDGASDMSMLYAYLHLIDPTTGVKEGEFKGAASSGSLGDKIQGAVNSIVSGGRLSDNLRQSFVRESKNIYENWRKGHDMTADQYEKLAKKYGLDPERVVTRFTRPQEDVASSQYTEGQTATAADGHKLVFRNGAWGPL